MGWVAVGACTLIASYALYSFAVRQGKKSIEHTLIATPHHNFHEEKTIAAAEEPPAGKPDETVHQNGRPIPPSFDFSPPSVEVEDTNYEPVQIKIPETHSQRPQPKQTTMAPPTAPRCSSPPRLNPPTFSAMPAPPRPSNGFVRPPPSAAASLRVPQTKVLSNASMAPSSLGVPKKQASKQVTLKPGHSPLDWATLTSNPNSRLRGKDAPPNLIKVTPSQLKYQNGRKGRDAWTVYQGKVYNITPYLPFHPGGEGEIMRGASKDSAKLFMEAHPWVNWDGMLGECLVGIFVSEAEAVQVEKSGGLDEMD